MVIKCSECDARVEVKQDDPAPRCEYCGTPLSVPRGGDAITDLMGRVFADTDGDGTPDLFQNAASGGGNVQFSAQTYIVNGKQYSSVDELPPEARRALADAQRVLGDAAGGGAAVVRGPTTVSTSYEMSGGVTFSTETASTSSTLSGRPRLGSLQPPSAPNVQAPWAPSERTPPKRVVMVPVLSIIGLIVLGAVVWLLLR